MKRSENGSRAPDVSFLDVIRVWTHMKPSGMQRPGARGVEKARSHLIISSQFNLPPSLLSKGAVFCSLLLWVEMGWVNFLLTAIYKLFSPLFLSFTPHFESNVVRPYHSLLSNYSPLQTSRSFLKIPWRRLFLATNTILVIYFGDVDNLGNSPSNALTPSFLWPLFIQWP